MRATHRTSAFLRQIENRWVTSESSFIEPEWWDACCTGSRIVSEPSLQVWVGVDASTKRDSTGITVCAWDIANQKVQLVSHRIFQPTPQDPLDFEATVEKTLLDMRSRYTVRGIYYDPYQMHAVAGRLRQQGLPMWEFPQTVANLTDASTNLYELIKGGNIVAYRDDEIRLAMTRAVAIESSRGWKIAKEKSSHKIDVVVALATAALFAVRSGQYNPGSFPSPIIVTAGDRFAAVGGRTKLDFARDW
jgi:phage terminase large subunit-like protein